MGFDCRLKVRLCAVILSPLIREFISLIGELAVKKTFLEAESEIH
jgi:hypothetical protein